MLPKAGQFVNIHAHRTANTDEEWVITNLRTGQYPPDPKIPAKYSVGFHPWDITPLNVTTSLKKVSLSLGNEMVIAIGESGLDKSIDADMELQDQVFRSQISIAQQSRLPVIIHAVKANQELISVIKEMQPEIPLIIHGFRGNIQLAESLVSAGFYLSFGEPLLESPKAREAAKGISLEHLFLETDESDLNISILYEQLAELKEMELDQLKTHMITKTTKIFRKISKP